MIDYPEDDEPVTEEGLSAAGELLEALGRIEKLEEALVRAKVRFRSLAAEYAGYSSAPQVLHCRYIDLLREAGPMRVQKIAQALHGSTDYRAMRATRAMLAHLKRKGILNNEERGSWGLMRSIGDPL